MTDLMATTPIVRKGDVLPPYNRYATCPKCGSKDIGTKHVPEPPWHPTDHAEHIVRTCRNCSYQWAEGALS